MRIWNLGDYIDTDAILPAKYLNNNDPSFYSKYCLESEIERFSENVVEGDIILAGECFGYGSSRESAPFAIKYLGIKGIFANSFSRIFFRNAINIGLPVIITSEKMKAQMLRALDVKFDDDYSEVIIVTKEAEYRHQTGYSQFIKDILNCGGLLNYLKKEVTR